VNIGNKTDPGWIFKWIKNPKSYNPHTKMPQFFGLSNAAEPVREDVEIDAIKTYLIEHTAPAEMEMPKSIGEAARGEKLVHEIARHQPQAVMGLFPRHIHRLASWQDALSRLGKQWILRSAVSNPVSAGTVIIWDTFGEF